MGQPVADSGFGRVFPRSNMESGVGCRVGVVFYPAVAAGGAATANRNDVFRPPQTAVGAFFTVVHRQLPGATTTLAKTC